MTLKEKKHKIKKVLLSGRTFYAIERRVKGFFSKHTPDEVCEALETIAKSIDLPPVLAKLHQEMMLMARIGEEQSLLYMLQEELSKDRIELCKDDRELKLVSITHDVLDIEDFYASPLPEIVHGLKNLGYYFAVPEINI